jgi:hypothetical protein
MQNCVPEWLNYFAFLQGLYEFQLFHIFTRLIVLHFSSYLFDGFCFAIVCSSISLVLEIVHFTND